MLAKGTAREIRDSEFPKLFGDEYLLTTQQAALYLNISDSALNHWRSDGAGPRFIKLGASIRYRMADLRQYIESRSYCSTGEAEYALTKYRVSDSFDVLDCKHPFIVRNRWFVVSSAYADRETFLSIFRDPFVKLAWLLPVDAVSVPWVREEERLVLLQAYLNCQNNRADAEKQVNQGYQAALAKLPNSNYGSHPDLTVAQYRSRLQTTIDGLHN